MTGNDIARRVAHRLTLTLVALTVCVSAQAQVTVTYIANAGFLLEGGGKKVLIDALFDEGIDGYMRIPRDIKQQLRDAQAPFDNVDLVVLTHAHLDHFGPRTVTRHMRANAKATLVCTPQVRAGLERHIKNDPGIAERIVAVYPKEGETIEAVYAGINVEVFNLHHGRNASPPIENLGFMMELGSMNVLHPGDTEATIPVFDLYKFQDRRTDLAILPVWLVGYPHWGQAIHDYVRPAHIVAMHMPLPDAPGNFWGQHASYEGRVTAVRQMFPDAVLLETPGDSRTFEPDDGDRDGASGSDSD